MSSHNDEGRPLDIVGQSKLRPDAPSKLTGQACYVNDLSFPGMLHAAVVRSTKAKAKILSVDTEKAKAMPGVRAVLTWEDVPSDDCVPLVSCDLPMLAKDQVDYYAEGIALVAADTLEQAQAAAREVKVEYEDLEPVLSIEAGYEKEWFLTQFHLDEEGVDEAFADPNNLVTEGVYRTGYQEHAYLETNGVIVMPDSYGGYIAFSSMQCPFYVQKGVAHILNIDYQKVRAVQTVTGGGFGGKEDAPSTPACMAAVLSYHTQRPVKLIFSREEDIDCMSKRHPVKVIMKSAVDKATGKIKAVDILHLMDCGAYLTLSSIVLWRGFLHCTGPYNIPAARIHSYGVGTNTVPCGAFRGFGQPQVCFSDETHWNEVAENLGLDPVEFRRRNMLRLGDTTVNGQHLEESVGLEQILDKVEAEIEYDKWKNRPRDMGRYRQGVGISLAYYGVSLGANGGALNNGSCQIVIAVDGSVQIGVGTVEMGQGMVTVLGQIAAETLRCPLERIHFLNAETGMVPEGGPTVASRTTMISGRAIVEACTNLRHRLDEFQGERCLDWNDLIHDAWVAGVQLSEAGWVKAPKCTFDAKTGKGAPYPVYTWCANAAQVTVDTYTGEVTVDKFVSGNEVGKVINPSLCEGQVHGGALQGIGYTLYEDMPIKNGRLRTNNFSTYILPTTMDVPDIVPVFAEEPYSWGPYGAKGFGETPMVPVAPAITQAVYNAIGIRFHELPLTPDRVWAALQSGENHE